MIEFNWTPDWRWLLPGAILAAGICYASYHFGRGAVGRPGRLLLFGLRLVVLSAALFCLLDPQRVRQDGYLEPGRIAVLVDTSRSMAWADDTESRLDQAKDWVQRELKVPENFVVSTYGFSSNLVSLSKLDQAGAAGGRTDIAGALENLAVATAQNPPDSVLLLSDGGDNSFGNLEAAAKSYARRKIPVYTVAFGVTNEPPDIVVENVQVQRVTFNQATTKAIVTVRSSGFKGQVVPLRIMKGDEAQAETTVRLTGGSQRVDVEFTPPDPGFYNFAAEIPAQNGERLLNNNRREFGFTVVDQVLHVIYMEATGMQQGVFQPLYLKHALEETPGFKVKTLYTEQNFMAGARPPDDSIIREQVAYVDPRNGDKIYRVRNSTEGYPKTLKELLNYDVLIFSDVAKSDFTPEQLAATESFVTKYGGGFAMVGGNTSFGSGDYQDTVIDNLIPVAMEQQNDIMNANFVPHVPEAAWSHPLMQISRNPEENRAIWTEKFPHLVGYNRVDRPKPGAVVLLENPYSSTAYGPDVILAAQEVGNGRTLAFTSDTTYLWGEYFETIWGEKINPGFALTEANCDSRYFKQFWVNAIRWLAAPKFDRDRNSIAVELPQTYCPPGIEIPVRVGAWSREGAKISDAGVTLRLMDENNEVQTVKALYSEAEQRYLAAIKVPAAGRFVLRTQALFKDGRDAEDQQLVVGEETDLEMADIRANPATLAAVSQWSGGRILSPDHNDQPMMFKAFVGDKPATVKYLKTRLWDNAWYLGTIIGLLTVEWSARRLRGMA
ncbi:MAG: glutamine amidotransferase [Verrucomicrobiota bacterium]|jgi:uncharacterized membrane protein